VLGSGGHDVRAAGSAEQAVGLLRERVPAVVVLDAVLPDRSGFDLCRQIRAMDLPTQPRVVLLTALDRVADEAAQAGFDRVLAKTVNPAQVLACVAELGTDRRSPDGA
jgi:DNA-binding response OmpR family regulator